MTPGRAAPRIAGIEIYAQSFPTGARSSDKCSSARLHAQPCGARDWARTGVSSRGPASTLHAQECVSTLASVRLPDIIRWGIHVGGANFRINKFCATGKDEKLFSYFVA